MSELDKRLNRMIAIADETGLTLDEVVKAIGRADQRTFCAISDSASRLPLYIKSKVTP